MVLANSIGGYSIRYKRRFCSFDNEQHLDSFDLNGTEP